MSNLIGKSMRNQLEIEDSNGHKRSAKTWIKKTEPIKQYLSVLQARVRWRQVLLNRFIFLIQVLADLLGPFESSISNLSSLTFSNPFGKFQPFLQPTLGHSIDRYCLIGLVLFIHVLADLLCPFQCPISNLNTRTFSNQIGHS